MRILSWAVRLILFVVLAAFAAKNTDPVTLRFYFGLAWQTPLVALLFAFFVAGALLGVMAILRSYFSQRREIARLEGKILKQEAKSQAVAQPPAAEG